MATSLSLALASGEGGDLLAALAATRVKIDTMSQVDYMAFLENHFLPLRDLLLANPIQYVDTEANKLRHAVLDIFSRLPQQGVRKEYVGDLISVGIKTLSEDNESNALLALKIVSDMNRAFRTQLEHNVQLLMECVYKIYDNMPEVINSFSGHNMSMTSSSTSSLSIMNMDVELVTMSSSSASASSSSSFSSSSSAKGPARLCKASESTRVLTECPVLVLLLFQLYPRCIPKSIPYLVPVMVNMLRLSPQPPQDKYDKVAVITYRDFFVSQVKTLSLVTHLVRTHPEPMRLHETNVVYSIMSMFHRCPDDSMSSRKDVLASTRYIVNSDYRNIFLPWLDEILGTNIFFGPHENLKSAAYVVTAELVTNLKDYLTQRQLFSIVLLFCNIISDSKIVFGTQLVSVRLIFNFADKVSKVCAEDGFSVLPAACDLILSILKCIVRKYQSFRIEIDKKWAVDAAAPERTSPVSWTEMHEKDAMKNYDRDAKHLMKTMIWGMRSLFATVQNMRNPHNMLPFFVSAALHSQYFRGALECCLIFSSTTAPGKESLSVDGSEKSSSDNNAEMKDVLEHFVISLRELPPDIFREVLSRNMEFLSELALKENMFLYVMNSLLLSKKTTEIAVDVTLSYFISRLSDLRHITPALKPGADRAEDAAYKMGQRSTILLRLFKFALAAIGNCADNEGYLRSRLSILVMESLRLANNSREPVNYYYLLKNVFKTITNAKLEESYKEMEQWIHHLVLGVESLLRRTANQNMQCFILELSILLPAKFLSLTSFLPNLLGFVVKALKMKGELPQLALRTLEFWIENLNPAFLSNILENAGLSQELLEGVASHLLPFPYLYGTLALRVIGKLGGHTQKLVKQPSLLYAVTSQPRLCTARGCLGLRIEDSSIMNTDTVRDMFRLQLDGVVFGACEILCSAADWASMSDGEGMVFLPEIPSVVKMASTVADLSKLLPEKALSDHVAGSTPVGDRADAKRFVKETKTVRDKLYAEQKKTAFRLIVKALYHILGSPVMNIAVEAVANEEEISSVSRLLEEILYALITSAGDPVLAEFSSLVLNGVCLHFAILYAQFTGRRQSGGDNPFPILVSCVAVNEAIIRAASQIRPHIHHAAMLLLRVWMLSLQKVLGQDRMRLSENAIVYHIAKQCTLLCHERSWSERIGAIRVLAVMCDSLPHGWSSEMQIGIVEAFMASLKDAPGELVCVALKDIYEALRRLIISSVGAAEKELKRLLQLLLQSLVDESSLVRLAANSAIETICSLRNTGAKELFHDFGPDISSLLGIQRPMDSFLEEEGIGYIYGLTYCLNKDILQIPSTIQQWSVMSLLSTYLSRSLGDRINADKMFRKRNQGEDPSGINQRFPEDYIIHLSVFPIEVPHAMSLRLALLHCLSAIFSNSRMMDVMKNNSDFIASAFSLILQSFHLQWADIISCSQTGLERAITWLQSQGLNLPSSLLQDCLKIFLKTLAEPGRLSLAFLEGVKAFVKIPNLAENLDITGIYGLCIHQLETLAALDPESYLKTYEAGSHRGLVVGFVEILNELPSSVFPQGSVKKLCFLAHAFEVSHHRFSCVKPLDSPFVGTICQFFVKSPDETRHLFIRNMHLPEYLHIFEVMLHIFALKSTESTELGRCLASAEGVGLLVSDMIQAFEVSSVGDNAEEQAPKRQKFDRLLNCEDWPTSLHYQILVTEILVDFLPDIDSVKMQLLAVVRQLWRHAVLSKPTTATRNQFRIREDVACLCKILASFCTMGLCQAELLLELVHVVSLDIGPNINFMYDLFQEKVPSLISPAVVQELIGMFLALAPDASMSMKWKSHCLRHLILPLVEGIFADKASSLKKAFADGRLVLGIASLWCTCSQPPVSPTCASPFAEDKQDDDSHLPVVALPPPTISTLFLRNNPASTVKSMSAELWDTDMKIEYLKLTFVFLSQAHTMSQRTKLHFKKFVKYPWHILKAEELSSVRQGALVNLCRYASALGNSKFASSLYTHVLKNQIEGKDMFSGTADEIVPLIARSLPDELIRLMRLTKKMLQDETLTALQHAHILQIILKYPTVFYPFRVLLSSLMLQSVTRLGFNPNSSTEVRQMTLGIVEVFLIWENTRQDSVREGKIDDDFYKIQKRLLLSQSSPDIYPEHNYGGAAAATSQNDYKLTPPMLSILMSFLLRLSLSKETTQSQARSCVGFFRTYIDTFPMTGVKITNWEKMVHSILEGIKANANAVQQDQANPALKQQQQFSKAGSGIQPKPQATMAMKNPLPEHLMLTSLDMLTICLDAPEISLQIFTPHIFHFTAYFQAIFNSENTLLHDSFSAFIVRVVQASLATPTPEFFESGFYRKLKSEMELQFRFNAQALLAPHSSLLLSLRLIRDITKVVPSWIDNHGSSLVRLCQRLLVEITQRNAKLARSDPSVGFSDDDNLQNVNNFHPTPSVSVMAEFLPAQLVSSNKPNLNPSADSCIELAYIFELLLGGIRHGFLEQFKQAIAHLVTAVIEGSLGQILSNTVAEFCLDEVLVADSHLSRKEQHSLFSKILQQHDKCLETVSHGYSIRMSCVSERLGPKYQQASTNSSLKGFTKINGIGHLGLMSPERTVREQCQTRVFASFGATPYERLLTFLAADIPCISHRHWPALLTPIFLHGFTLTCDASCFSEVAVEKENFGDDEIDGESCSARYSVFQSLMAGVASQTCEDLKSDILELSLMHIESGERVWKQLLQQVWITLEATQREELTLGVMKSFLRNPQRKRTTWSAEIPGAGQISSLLSAFFQLESPRPQFPTEFLACAVEHGGMSLGYDILAGLYAAAASRPADCGIFDSSSIRPISPEILSNRGKVRAAAAQDIALQIFSSMEDREMTLATLRCGIVRPETDLCLSLETYGFITKAQEMLVKLIARENRINDSEVVAEESDVELLQSRWMECAKELGQWRSICSYARNVGMIELAVESASRTCDFETLRDLRESHVLLSVGRQSETDKFCMQEVQRTLTQWSNRPEVSRGSLFHKNMLHNFHRIIELRESATMLAMLSTSSEGTPDLSQFFHSWRSRLPLAVFGDTSVGVPGILGWDSLLTWRGYIRGAVAPPGMRSPKPSIAVENAWEGLKWAKLAQQQAYYGSRQNASLMPRDLFAWKTNETQEIFATIRGRVLHCLHDQQRNYTDGPQECLQLLKGVNMSLFENDKVAEMLRLKALCEAHLSMVYEAHETFAQSVQTDESNAKSWLSWGQYCQELIKHDGADVQARSKLGHYAISCVLKAAQLDAASVRSHLAGIVRVMQSCDDELLNLATELVSSAEKASSWIWLGLVPSLVSMLPKKSGDLVKILLIHIARRHPQPVLHHVMTLQSDTVKSGKVSPQNAAILSRCAEIISNACNPRAVALLRRFGDELSADFSADKLFDMVQCIRTAVADISDETLWGDSRTEQKISEKTKTHVLRITSEHFSDAFSDKNEMTSWLKFKSDMSGALRSPPAQLLLTLVAWLGACEEMQHRRRRISQVENFARSDLRASSFCPQSFFGIFYSRLELPGQLSRIRGDNRDDLVHIMRLLPSKDSGDYKQYCFLGSDGQTYAFAATLDGKNTEQKAALFKNVVDWSLQQSAECQRRDLSLESVEVTPLPGKIILQRMMASQLSLSDVVLARLSETNSSSCVQMKYLELALSQSPDVSLLDANIFSYEQVCASLVPSTGLHESFVSWAQSSADLYNLRRSVAANLGVLAAFQYALCSKPPSARELSFSIVDKSVFARGVGPSLTEEIGGDAQGEGALRRYPIPWRLTRSITAALSIPLLNGIMAPSLGCTLDAISQNTEVIQPFFELILMDRFEDFEGVHGNSSPDAAGAQNDVTIQRTAARMLADVNTICPSHAFRVSYPSPASFKEQDLVMPPIDAEIKRLLHKSTLMECILSRGMQEPYL